MPRNASSTYSLPAGNPVVPGTIIATTWANTTLTDIATALTQSLSTDGSTASVSLANKTMSGGTFSSPTVSGLLNLTSGQIAFPAVQSPSSNANTLDDYEEGTWTPSITFQTPGNLAVTYTTRLGLYTKVGDICTVTMVILTSSFTHSTASGSLFFTGLPFTHSNVAGSQTAMALGNVQGVQGGSFSFANGVADVNDTRMRITATALSSGAITVVTTAGCVSGSTQGWTISGTYKTT